MPHLDQLYYGYLRSIFTPSATEPIIIISPLDHRSLGWTKF